MIDVVPFTAVTKGLSVMLSLEPGSGGHPAFCSVGTGRFFLQGSSGQSFNPMTVLQVTPKLTVRAGLPRASVCALSACI